MENLLSYKNIARVAIPIMISSIAQNVVNVTDTIFLGNVSEIALGAAGNAGIFYYILIIAGMGFTTGAQIIIGRRNGEGNYHQIGNVFNHTLFFIVPVAVILFVFFKLFSPDFINLITKSDKIALASNQYLSWRSYGVLFAFVIFSFNAFYIGTTRTGILIWGTVVTMITNVILDYALIFGKLGFPEMGIEGAAIASFIAEATTFVFIIIYTLITVDLKKYQLFRYQGFNGELFKRIINIGTPVMLQYFLSVFAWFVFFLIIEKMGEEELAAAHIVRSIYMVLIIPMFGYSSAINTLVSNLIGQQRQSDVKKLIGRVLVLNFGTTLLVLFGNIFFPEEIVGLYTDNPNLIRMSLDSLIVINMSMFFLGAAFIIYNSVTGTGKTKISMLIEFATIVIYLFCAYNIALVYKQPLHIVWASEFIYCSLLGGFSALYLKFGNWRQAEV